MRYLHQHRSDVNARASPPSPWRLSATKYLLLYAAENDATAGRKAAIARELLLQPGLRLSEQVLNEFIANANAKFSFLRT